MVLLPTINATGIWTLRAPFDTLLSNKAHYTCISVTKLEKLESLGEFPFNDYYIPYSLDKQTYKNDLANQVCIITVKSETGVIHSFPSSYLQSFPAGNGVEYGVMGLAIGLGPLPIDTDFTSLKQAVSDMVRDKVGITSTVQVQLLSDAELLSHDTHERLVAARRLNIRESVTPESKVLRLQEELNKEREKVKLLQEALVAMKNKS